MVDLHATLLRYAEDWREHGTVIPDRVARSIAALQTPDARAEAFLGFREHGGISHSTIVADEIEDLHMRTPGDRAVLLLALRAYVLHHGTRRPVPDWQDMSALQMSPPTRRIEVDFGDHVALWEPDSPRIEVWRGENFAAAPRIPPAFVLTVPADGERDPETVQRLVQAVIADDDSQEDGLDWPQRSHTLTLTTHLREPEPDEEGRARGASLTIAGATVGFHVDTDGRFVVDIDLRGLSEALAGRPVLVRVDGEEQRLHDAETGVRSI